MKLAGPLVLRVNKHLTVFIPTVETFTVVITDSGTSQSQYLTISVTLCASICTPKTDLDGKIAFICDTDVPSIFHRPALLYVHLSQDSNLSDNSNRVNCPHLLKVVDFLDRSEAEATILN